MDRFAWERSQEWMLWIYWLRNTMSDEWTGSRKDTLVDNERQQHRLRLIFVQLEAMAATIPPVVYDHQAERYNKLVDELVDLGYQLEDLRISENDLYRRLTSSNYITGVKTYSDHQEVHYGVYGAKLNALIRYFGLLQNATIVEVDAPIKYFDDKS